MSIDIQTSKNDIRSVTIYSNSHLFNFGYTQNGNEIQLCLVLKFEKNSLNKS